ncbi:MAG: tRNA (guanosine(37)-N1)-methyltransferase TrmD [Oscillospiraceae bacterium]|nr:tRNA (guanosine(37)-N1)-methyltransferase TrmD [Oscillospiraceae bacterium]
MSQMRIDILTLFPDTVNAVLHESILGRAADKGLVEISCVQIRDYTENKQCQVDDYPYGGGWGCVMMAQPLKSCLDSVMSTASDRHSRVIYLSPQGEPYTQETAKRLVRDYDHLVLVCGHYEGVDERFIEACVDEEISLGDFVLTGGEIAAMAVADSVCRLVPGVLSDEQCYVGESHWDGLLEYPQYTRPELWEGREVPPVLLNGDHEKVEKWRRKQQFLRTMEKRPDLFEKFVPADKDDQKLLEDAKKEAGRLTLTEPVSCRAATAEELPALLALLDEGKALLRERGIDQWQDGYPDESLLRADLARGELYAVRHGGELAGFFVLSTREEPWQEAISDGKWTPELPYATLHRSVVTEKYRGTGLSEKLLALAEREARALGAKALRTDTHKKNKAVLRLLRENGYRYRGNIVWPVEPGHDNMGQAFEKILKDRK